VHRLRLLSWFTAALKTRLIQTTWVFFKEIQETDILEKEREKWGKRRELKEDLSPLSTCARDGNL
jgi:hypothetical protein